MARKKEPLSSADVAWLRMDRPTNLMMITGVMTFDDLMTPGELRAVIAHRLLIFDRFKQRVADRYATPHWQDDPHFDLDRHLLRVALPAPGGQQELQRLVSDLMNTPFDFERPLWQMHLVENYGGTGCALIARFHHCIADGIALIHVMMSMADESFDPSHVPPVPGPSPSNSGRLAQLIEPVVKVVSTTVKAAEAVLHESMDMVLHPSHLLERAKQGMSIGAATSRLLLMSADSETIFKGELGIVKRAAWSRPVSLAGVKAIGQRIGGKVNDVLLAAVSGALRRYLLSHHQPVDDVEIRALIPVNLRPPEEAYKLGNHFGLVFLSLPVGIEDPRERLLEVKRHMDGIKHSAEAPVTLGILQVIGLAPKQVQDQVVNLMSAKATAVMTNVPGPRERLHLGGKTIRHMMFWVPRSGPLSLGVSIISYAGEVLLGVATDTNVIPDPETLIDGFHTEFEALQERFVKRET